MSRNSQYDVNIFCVWLDSDQRIKQGKSGFYFALFWNIMSI
jgi:hypothetical protein